MRRPSVLLLVATLATAACAAPSAETQDGTSEADETARPLAKKSAEVRALDDLVTAINGTGSVDAWMVDHLRDFDESLDTDRLASPPCTQTTVIEAKTRWITRERATGRIRKLGLTWSGWRGNVSTTHHETYHYDAEGRLRVAIIDVEDDHTTDDAYMDGVLKRNQQLRRELDAMPLGSEAERAAVAQKGRELEDSTTVSQIRIYFTAAGERLYETVRPGLERARELDYGDIANAPPILYGNVHPANVSARPVIIGLNPAPMYRFEPLPEYAVSPSQSAVETLAASARGDAEATLAAPSVCR